MSLWDQVRRAFMARYPRGRIHRVENTLMRGMPDVVWCAPGYGDGWIELKDGRDRESRMQEAFRHDWSAAGGRSALIHRVGTPARYVVYLGASDEGTTRTCVQLAIKQIVEDQQ